MVKVVVEFGNIARSGQAYSNMLNAEPVSAITINTPVTGVGGGTGPTVPTGATVAVVTAIDGNVRARAGADASQTTGKLCLQGQEQVIHCRAGQKIGIVDLT